MLYLIKLNDQFVQKKFLQFHFIYHSSSNDIRYSNLSSIIIIQKDSVKVC